MRLIGPAPITGQVSTSQIEANAIDGTKTKDSLIGDYSDTTISSSDLLMFGDQSDSNNTKRDTVQGILDLAGGMTLSSETATTSGTAHTITGIPSGTKQINLMHEGVSLNGTGAALDTSICDAGGLETSGYLGCDAKIDGSETVTTSTAAWEAHLATDSAAYLVDGIIQLTLKDSSNFTWVASWNLSSSGSNTRISIGAGVKSLSAELTQVSLSGGTFDAGSIAVSYI